MELLRNVQMLTNVLLARVSVAAVLTELLHLRVCASLDIMVLTAIKVSFTAKAAVCQVSYFKRKFFINTHDEYV